MITFRAVSKRFPAGTLAVDRLDLEIKDGELTVLVGPSGCGKTTTLRMINRLEDPTEGTIEVDGENVMQMELTRLRRGVGYVMQHSGLFPHRTVFDNVATVPRLLGWDRERTRRRVTELIELAGLSEEVVDRYPHQLSGGQQQRVGVARALAADPPIMLMDEPFAAVDPIVRTRLQDEFLHLQRKVRKTIVFVTHDIGEAIKLGDRIAIFQYGGRLAQYAPPTELLAEPASEFVVDFLGPERELKRLALIPVSAVAARRGPCVTTDASVPEALAAAGHCNTDWIVVVDGGQRLQGWTRLSDLDGVDGVGKARIHAFKRPVSASDSLRAALNAMVSSEIGVAARVDADGRFEGLLAQEDLRGRLA